MSGRLRRRDGVRLLVILACLLALAVLLTAPAPGAPAAPAAEIAFWRKCGTGCGDLYLVRADGTSLRRLTRTNVAFSPSWSPDGRRLVYAADPGGRAGAYELFALDLASRRTTRLTRTPATFVSFAPAWSPDGRSIAFVRARFGTAASHALYVLDLKSGAARRIAAGANPDSAPAWSPDSKWLAFTGGEQIELVRANGSDRRPLVRGADPTWSPDGRRIAFTGEKGVAAVDVRTLKTQLLVSRGSDPSWSPDGRVAFTTLQPTGGTGLAILSADRRGVRTLTRPGNLRHDLGPAWRP